MVGMTSGVRSSVGWTGQSTAMFNNFVRYRW